MGGSDFYLHNSSPAVLDPRFQLGKLRCVYSLFMLYVAHLTYVYVFTAMRTRLGIGHLSSGMSAHTGCGARPCRRWRRIMLAG